MNNTKSFFCKLVTLLFTLLVLSSCTNKEILESQSQDLKTNYHNALAVGYRNLAKWEEKKYDWQDSDYFAKKGLRAKAKMTVALEDPTEHNIKDPDYLEELLFYRMEFSKLQTDEVKIKFALEAANLQILYDSWVEQTEEDPTSKSTRRFRKEFIDGYKQLKRSLEILREEEIKENKLKEKNFHTVYFDLGQSTLDITATKELNNLIYYLTNLPKYKLVIEGHADKVGAVENNLKLSRERVLAVRQYLLSKGVSRDRILKENAYGETKPNIDTDKAYSDRVNRRVEIYVITNLE